MDIRRLFNHCKVAACICVYLSKSEIDCWLAMKQVVRDAFEKELNNYENIKSVACVYINNRDCKYSGMCSPYFTKSVLKKNISRCDIC